MPSPEKELPEKLDVWFCPVCGERMAGKSYEVDELRVKCTKTKHKALARSFPYVAASSPAVLTPDEARLLDVGTRVGLDSPAELRAFEELLDRLSTWAEGEGTKHGD